MGQALPEPAIYRPSAFATMRTAFLLALPATLILCASQSVLAQLGTNLVLVRGDTSNSSKPRCSFTSETILGPIPLVQGLLGVQTGDPPDQVQSEMRFAPDRPYANSVLQWTAMKGGQYVKAVVTFRNDGAHTRSFTMAINYKQPNQKQCQWEVQETQQGAPQNNFSSSPSAQ